MQLAELYNASVAPFTGAWIETIHKIQLHHKRRMSHPSRVRGLKLLFLLSWHKALVAPFTGAWIETWKRLDYAEVKRVAPFTGAWIETLAKDYKATAKPSRTLHGCVD